MLDELINLEVNGGIQLYLFIYVNLDINYINICYGILI